MKKINLRGLSEVLTTKELRNVMGGSGDGNNSNKTCYHCMNGAECFCEHNDTFDSCYEDLIINCPGGWMEWSC